MQRYDDYVALLMLPIECPLFATNSAVRPAIRHRKCPLARPSGRTVTAKPNCEIVAVPPPLIWRRPAACAGAATSGVAGGGTNTTRSEQSTKESCARFIRPPARVCQFVSALDRLSL